MDVEPDSSLSSLAPSPNKRPQIVDTLESPTKRVKVEAALPQPLLLLAAAQTYLSSAYALSPALSSPKCSVQVWQHFCQRIQHAILCLQRALQLIASTVDAKVEWDLEARLMLVQILLDEKMVASDGEQERLATILQKGLLVAASHNSLRAYKLALQEVQIRFWLATGQGSLKSACSEARRIASALGADDGYWKYRLLLLAHTLLPTSASLSQLLDLAGSNKDTVLIAALRIHALHQYMINSKQDLAEQELAALDPLYTAEGESWPAVLQIYYHVLKAMHMSWFLSQPKIQVEAVKAVVAKLHVLFGDEHQVDEDGVKGVIRIPIHSTKTNQYVCLSCPSRSLLEVMTYLISAIAHRDLMGKSAKPIVYLDAGITEVDNILKKPTAGSVPCASLHAFQETSKALLHVKALCLLFKFEFLLGRSKIAEAQANLNQLKQFVCAEQPELWPIFQARIVLAEGMLCHSLDKIDRALKCYHVVLQLEPGNLSAILGIVFVRISQGENMQSAQEMSNVKPANQTWIEKPLVDAIAEAIKLCAAARVPVYTSAGHLLSAMTQPGIVKPRYSLTNALTCTTDSGNLILQPYILSLLSTSFTNTKQNESKKMLESAYQIARSMGATKSKPRDEADVSIVGNARLGLFLGEKLLEQYKSEGDQVKIVKQTAYNTIHASVVASIPS